MAAIIGISGYARSGKDTFFKVIRMFNPNLERVAFADLLKDEVKDIVQERYGLDVYSQITEEKNIFRPLLIEHGAGMRKIDKDYWLKAGMARAEQLIAEGKIPVVTDVRYANEAQAIIDRGGIVISLHRQNTSPAHEEEENSIKEILEMDHRALFDFEWETTFYNETGELIASLEEVQAVNAFLERCTQDALITQNADFTPDTHERTPSPSERIEFLRGLLTTENQG